MKAFASWSGGKESAMAFYYARVIENLKVQFLLNMLTEDGIRSRSHGISAKLLRIQAEAIGVSLIQRKTSWKTYEEEFKTAVFEMKPKGIKVGVFGDIDLQEHRDWVERVCKEVNVKPILPLWEKGREELLIEFIQLGFQAIVVATEAELLGEEWLGRIIDHNFIKDLKARENIDLCGERGEYHTFVYGGPIFQKPVKFIFGKKIRKEKHWFLELKPFL